MSGLGTAVSSVALPLVAVIYVHASAWGVAALGAAQYAPWLILGLPAGVLVGALPLRASQVAMDIIRGLAVGSVAVLGFLEILASWELVAVALVVGTSNVFFDIGNASFLPSVVPRELLNKRNSLVSASAAVVSIAGPSIGGVLVQWLGSTKAMLSDSASYFVSAVFMLSLDRPPPLARGLTFGFRQQLAEGIHYVLDHKVILPSVIAASAINLINGMMLTLVPLFLVRGLHAPSFAVGLVYGAEGLGGLIGASLVGPLSAKFGSARLMLMALVPLPLAVLFMAAATGLFATEMVAVGASTFAGTVVISSILTRTHRQLVVPAELLPRVTATVRFISWGMIPAGSLLSGGLASEFSLRSALAAAVVLSLAGPVSLWRSHELRSRVALED